MSTIRLTGCSPVPLAHYLKALAILRLISEQRDGTATGYWQGNTFVLDSVLDESALLHFFLHEYSPTPIVDPWNGGSGFYQQERKLNEIDPTTGKRVKTGARDQPTTATEIVDQLTSSQGHRLERYRGVLNMAKNTVNRMGLSEAPADLHKRLLIEKLRNELPDDCVCGIDSGMVLLESRVSYPPVLGTGWNDGRTDFASNFMQRIPDVFDINSDGPTRSAEKWLRAALFGESVAGLLGGAAIGQFFPAAAGGDNSGSGFRAESLLNPWDFILMIEGAVVFAGAALKRLESAEGGTPSAPFCVKPAGVGYATAAQADESSARPEMWMPLWNAPSGLSELRALMSEGRAQVAGRPARDGVDFARAIASLGVDRGIAAFQRYGFQVRNGLAYFATPLDRLSVTQNVKVDLLNDCDAWLDSFRRAATASSAPASAVRALRRLELAILALCKQGDAERVQDVLVALGGCEQAMARSLSWTVKSYLRPVSRLSSRWLRAADDCSAEYRLAASLASVYGKYGDAFIPLRAQLEPIKCGVKKWVALGWLGTIRGRGRRLARRGCSRWSERRDGPEAGARTKGGGTHLARHGPLFRQSFPRLCFRRGTDEFRAIRRPAVGTCAPGLAANSTTSLAPVGQRPRDMPRCCVHVTKAVLCRNSGAQGGSAPRASGSPARGYWTRSFGHSTGDAPTARERARPRC